MREIERARARVHARQSQIKKTQSLFIQIQLAQVLLRAGRVAACPCITIRRHFCSSNKYARMRFNSPSQPLSKPACNKAKRKLRTILWDFLHKLAILIFHSAVCTRNVDAYRCCVHCVVWQWRTISLHVCTAIICHNNLIKFLTKPTKCSMRTGRVAGICVNVCFVVCFVGSH